MFVIQPSLQKVSTVFHRCFIAFSHVNKPFQKRLPSIHLKNHVFYAWKELGSKFGIFFFFFFLNSYYVFCVLTLTYMVSKALCVTSVTPVR